MSGIEIGNLESLHTLVFSSLEFLFRYLPLFLILFYAVPKRFRMFVLFAFSLILYAVWRRSRMQTAKKCRGFMEKLRIRV